MIHEFMSLLQELSKDTSIKDLLKRQYEFCKDVRALQQLMVSKMTWHTCLNITKELCFTLVCDEQIPLSITVFHLVNSLGPPPRR